MNLVSVEEAPKIINTTVNSKRLPNKVLFKLIFIIFKLKKNVI